MTKKSAKNDVGTTYITFVLDRSQSMGPLMGAVIDGFNKMMEEQRADPSPCFVSLVLFDDKYDEVFLDRPLAEVPLLTPSVCFARGNTHLYDALARTISSLGARIDGLPHAKQPDKVIVVVHTDGAENGSTETTAAAVKKQVQEQQEEASWLFVFAGANIDAFAAGGNVGFSKGGIAGYQGSVIGTKALYGATSAAVLRSRGRKQDDYVAVARGIQDVFLSNEVQAMATGDSSLLSQSSVATGAGVALDPSVAALMKAIDGRDAGSSSKVKSDVPRGKRPR